MKKIFELLIFLLLLSLAMLVMSCGTRKSEIVKRDSIHIENNYSQGSKIVLGNSFTYKPFDNLKPMTIDNVVYKNVVITNDKTVTNEKWKNRNITKTITLEKTKKTEKKDNSILWIGIVFVISLFLFLYIWLPKIKY